MFFDILKELYKRSIIDDNTNCVIYKDGYFDGAGYGVITWNKRKQKIHRLSAHIFLKYDLKNKNKQINHKCNNKACWNPNHLYIGNQKQNVRDAIKAGTFIAPPIRQLQKYCNKGHELTKDNIVVENYVRRCKICRIANIKRAIEVRRIKNAKKKI